jgi:hypothetical protein
VGGGRGGAESGILGRHQCMEVMECRGKGGPRVEEKLAKTLVPST